MIGTGDQSCWLAEACKTPSLDGLWIYGVTVLSGVLTITTVTNPHGCKPAAKASQCACFSLFSRLSDVCNLAMAEMAE